MPAWLAMSACSSLFWKQASEAHSSHWLSDERLVEVVFHYQEKDPFPPIAVETKLRRNYQTELGLLKIAGTRVTGTFGVGKLTVPGMLSANVCLFGNELVSVRRERADDPQSEQFVRVLPGGGQVQYASSKTAGGQILRLLISPDGKRLAIVGSWPEQHRIWIASSSTELAFPDDAARVLNLGGAEPDISWKSDSSALFVRGEQQVTLWDGRAAPKNAAQFPRCFAPSTRSDRLSADGRSFHRSAVGQPPSITRADRFIAHDKIPMISRIQDIGDGCNQ